MTNAQLAQPFFGTPDQWWEQAEPITEEEAAERHLGTWYIVAEMRDGAFTGAYRIARPTIASNRTRKEALERRFFPQPPRLDDIAQNVRALIRVPVERSAWMDADLVIANVAVDSTERVPWRRKGDRWVEVFNGSRSVSEQGMQQLNPTPAKISELTEETS